MSSGAARFTSSGVRLRDGSNLTPPGAPTPPFAVWPDALVEGAHAVPRPVRAGHFPWFYAPDAVRAALRELVARIG